MIRPGKLRSPFLSFFALLAVFAVFGSGSRAEAVPTLWGVDEDDGILFSIANYATLTGFTNWGELQWDTNGGAPGGLDEIGEHIEGFALDSSGVAYMSLNADLGSTDEPVLLSFNIADAAALASTPVAVIGQISGMGVTFNNGNDNISGLAIQPGTGDLYALFRDNDEDTVDKLLKIDKTTGSVLAKFDLDGLSHEVEDGEDLKFDHLGNLYVTDNEDDTLYKVDPTNGNILAIIDDDEAGGLGGDDGDDDLKIEALAWDPTTNTLLAFDDDRGKFLNLTLSDGANSLIGPVSGLTDVEGMDFVPAAIPEPTTVTLLGVGLLGLARHRRKAARSRSVE